MSEFFDKLMTKISASAGFPLIVFDREAKTMMRYSEEGVSRISVPSVLASDIDKDNIFFKIENINNKSYIIYFLRCVFGGNKYVIVINDLQSRLKLGRFFSVFIDIVRDMQGNRNVLIERINLLKHTLDEKLKFREKFEFDLKVCEDKMSTALKIRNEAVSRLKALAAEKDAVAQIAHEARNKTAMLEAFIQEQNLLVENLKKTAAESRQVVAKEYEDKIKELLKVHNESLIRLKVQTEENAKLQSSVSTVKEAVKRLEASVKSKEERMNQMREEFDLKLKNSSFSPEIEEKMNKMLAVRNEAVVRLKGLMEENKRLKIAPIVSNEQFRRLQDDIKNKEEEIGCLTKKINEQNEVLKAKDSKLAKTRFYLEEMTELVKVVKKSRDKIMTLTDFITVPMYSVSGERTLVHANNALANYVKSSNVAKIIGKSCYKLIFGLDSPCPWCQLEKIQKTGASTTVGVVVNDNGIKKNIELTIFPILDSTGTLIDCGEFIVDKTDTFELAQSLKKFKEQVISFKRAKISGMNEIQDVKRAYDDLSANYDLVVERNLKLSQALESFLVQDNNKEVVSARNEVAKYKAALRSSSTVIDNYKKIINELRIKYAALNKQTFTQLERLMNVIKTNGNVDMKEIESTLSSLGLDPKYISRITSEE